MIGKDSKLDCSQGKGGIPQGLWCYLCLAMNMLARTKNPVSPNVSTQIHLLRVSAAINEYVLAIEGLNQDGMVTILPNQSPSVYLSDKSMLNEIAVSSLSEL